jgi:hypothetical protein
MKSTKSLRHESSRRNRKKALHFAKNMVEELQAIDNLLTRLKEEHVRYALGRAFRLVNRIEAEIRKHDES